MSAAATEVRLRDADLTRPAGSGLARRVRNIVDTCALVGVCALLMFGVLAFGAVRESSTFVLEMGAALIACLWVVGHLLSGELPVFATTTLHLPMVVFGALVGLELALRIPAYTFATASDAAKLVAYFLLTLVVTQCCKTDRALTKMVFALSIFGFVVAIFGIAQSFTSPYRLYWGLFGASRVGALAYGPYVNHNHYAGLMEMLTPLPLMLAVSRSHRRKVILLGFAAIVMGGTIVLSLSRGGLLAFAVELCLLGVVAARRSSRIAGALAGVVVITIAFVVWLGSSSAQTQVHRLRSASKDVELRVQIARDSMTMFASRPWLGWGLGEFQFDFPRYRHYYSDEFAETAESDCVQLLVETGVVGVACALWFLVALYAGAFQRARNWNRDSASAIRLAALVGCSGFLVHSIWDSNFHVPANAALFFVLCGIAMVNTNGDR
jgi:O-antigen ligase